jgi:hypothetical protein
VLRVQALADLQILEAQCSFEAAAKERATAAAKHEIQISSISCCCSSNWWNDDGKKRMLIALEQGPAAELETSREGPSIIQYRPPVPDIFNQAI